MPNTPPNRFVARPPGPSYDKPALPSVGPAKQFAAFWKRYGENVNNYIKDSGAELRSVKNTLVGLRDAYTNLQHEAVGESVDIYVAELGNLVTQMNAIDCREETHNNVHDIIPASLDMDIQPSSLPEEYAHDFALIEKAQSLYKLLYKVKEELSAAYYKARSDNNSLLIWLPVQACIEQIGLFLAADDDDDSNTNIAYMY
jgi:hypothetical protein